MWEVNPAVLKLWFASTGLIDLILFNNTISIVEVTLNKIELVRTGKEVAMTCSKAYPDIAWRD
jgi:hypothetical protein